MIPYVLNPALFALVHLAFMPLTFDILFSAFFALEPRIRLLACTVAPWALVVTPERIRR